MTTTTVPFAHKNIGYSLYPEQASFLYQISRFARPLVIVDFATSLGFSALHFASAVKDNGVGHVYGSEIVPEKAAAAQANIYEAGLSEYVTIFVGDAREQLAQVPSPIDLCLIDGWPTESGPSISLEVLKILETKFRSGTLIINDNAEDDYLDYVHNPENGFANVTLPWKGATEISTRL